MKEKITPCLWFNGNGKKAAALYTSAFSDARIVSQSPIVTNLSIGGQTITLLDGGPQYKPNPSISFYYICEKEDELNRVWNAFSEDGTVMMALDTYPWGEKYGFVEDMFGISWQIALGKVSDVGQRITPALMFVGKQYGRAEEAMRFYETIFNAAKVDNILHYGADEAPEQEGKVKHAQMILNGYRVMFMDNARPHKFTFTEGVSLTVHCETQADVDHYWNHLTGSGGQESMCGWLKDKFGVSWQIVPTILNEIMSDPQRAGKAAKAFMSMRKLDIEQIVQASIS